jgi:hypoxanthine phosphoribosyltransferase
MEQQAASLTPASQAASGTAPEHARPPFAHPSEAEFARILDFYRIPWQYEPRSFPLRYAPDGRVIEQFTPDFYLPELDLYIELTTLKQSLVTRKNRKLRRLRELYPEIKIKLLYKRDIRSLLFKYGLIQGADGSRRERGHRPLAPGGSTLRDGRAT